MPGYPWYAWIASETSAACPTSITGASPGCTNSATITGINIHNANVTSSIVNTGTISTNGILVNTSSSITGQIKDTGTLVGGIKIDNTSRITGGTDIDIVGASTFSGGISNAGLINAAVGSAVILNTVSTFTGGITNSGTISSAHNTGIAGELVGTFSGGITNSGTISAQIGGIYFIDVGTFQGAVSNSGQISGNAGITLQNIGAATGGIANSGTISGGTNAGVELDSVNLSGNIANSGKIASQTGIRIIGSTINGSIIDTGDILGSSYGIRVDSGTINSTKTGVAIDGSLLTFTGGISNAGVIDGALFAIRMTSQVTPVSIFSGGITNSGTLLGGDTGMRIGGVLTFQGGITNAGTISAGAAGLQVGGISTFSGGVTNSGAILFGSLGGGIGLTVGPVSAFSGGVTNSGTISALSAADPFPGISVGQISTFSGDIINAGKISAALGIQLDTIATLSGNVSNSGSITASTGIAVSTGVTFAAGKAIVNTGNITGTTAAIDASVATSPVTIDQAGGTIAGAIKLSTNADVLNITGGVINGNIVGQGANDTINIAPTGFLAAFTYAAPYGFSGINQVNINSGFVVLDGTDNATNIDVNGGVLFGTGTLDPLTVTIHNGATLAPGGIGTPGTLTINGNLVFQPNATYLVQFGSGGGSLTNVSGTATLAGGVDAVVLPGTALAHQYTILHSAGLGGTTFNSLTVPAGLMASLTYVNFTDVDIDFTGNLPSAAPPGGFNINQQNVSTALNNYFNSGGTLPPGFGTVFGLSGTALADALTQLSGEAATGDQQAATQLMTQFLDMMLDPFVAGRDTGGGGGAGTATGFAPEKQAGLPPTIALAYDSVMPAPQSAFAQRWSAWGSGFGGSSITDGNAVAGSHNVTANTYGVAAGMDYHFTPDSVVGFALAGGGTNWSLAQNLGTGRSDAFQAGVYGKTAFGPAYLAAAFAFANHWFTTDRISFNSDQLSAKFQGQSYGGRFETGYRFAVASASGVTPYAAVQAQAFHTPGYSETDLSGGGFGLSYNAMNATDTRSELGARFDSAQVLGNMPIIWHGRVAWAHDWVSNPALGATFQSLPGASFTVNGAAPPPNSALASAGAKLYITPAWTFDAKFDGEFASGSQTYAGTGTLRYSW